MDAEGRIALFDINEVILGGLLIVEMVN